MPLGLLGVACSGRRSLFRRDPSPRSGPEHREGSSDLSDLNPESIRAKALLDTYMDLLLVSTSYLETLLHSDSLNARG